MTQPPRKAHLKPSFVRWFRIGTTIAYLVCLTVSTFAVRSYYDRVSLAKNGMWRTAVICEPTILFGKRKYQSTALVAYVANGVIFRKFVSFEKGETQGKRVGDNVPVWSDRENPGTALPYRPDERDLLDFRIGIVGFTVILFGTTWLGCRLLKAAALKQLDRLTNWPEVCLSAENWLNGQTAEDEGETHHGVHHYRQKNHEMALRNPDKEDADAVLVRSLRWVELD